MPRAAPLRQRVVFCDCFDCAEPTAAREPPSDDALAAAEAVAQQLPPPKALLIYGSGLIQAQDDGTTSLEACTLPHLDKAAKEGCIGVAAVRTQHSDAPVTAGGLSELWQFLGVYDELIQAQAEGASPSALPSLASMHKGLSLVAGTSSAAAHRTLRALGCDLPQVLQLLVPVGDNRPDAAGAPPQPAADDQQSWGDLGLPQPAAYATELLQALGPGEGASGPDALLLHLDVTDLVHKGSGARGGEGGAGELESARFDAATTALLWLDALVAQLLAVREVRQRVLLQVLVTPQNVAVHAPVSETTDGAASHQQFGNLLLRAPLLPPDERLDPHVAVVTPHDMFGATQRALGGAGFPATLAILEGDGGPGVPRPAQSWQFRGLKRVSIDESAPGVYLRRLPGVVRKDRAEAFTLREAGARGGLGAILIDRLLPEVAYKLGRAPKYGA